MPVVTLFQNKSCKGSSAMYTGDVTPDSATYSFLSMRIGPSTDVTVYDRNNDLIIIHNGTSKNVVIDDISTYVTITTDTTLTISSTDTVSGSTSAYLTVVSTGVVTDLQPESASYVSSIIPLIILLLIAYGVYRAWIHYRSTSLDTSTVNSSRIH